MNDSIQLSLVERFLVERNWTLFKVGERFSQYKPPNDLGLEAQYALTIPKDTSAPDSAEFLTKTVETLSIIHDLSNEQLRAVLTNASTIVSIRLVDPETQFGSIPFVQFEGLIDRLKKTLQDTAAFVLTDLPILGTEPPAASDYLSQCRFLQTEVGSFVANVQLPTEQVLETADLFKVAPTTAEEVNRKLEDVLGFIVGPVFSADESIFSSQAIEQYADLLNVDVLRDIAEMFRRTNSREVQFSFLDARSQASYSTGLLTVEKLERFERFIMYAREQLGAETWLDITGKIVELRSRDPNSNHNYVMVQTVLEDKPTNIAFTVAKADYFYATQAHVKKQTVRVVGRAARMRTQLRIRDLELFQVLEV